MSGRSTLRTSGDGVEGGRRGMQGDVKADARWERWWWWWREWYRWVGVVVVCG